MASTAAGSSRLWSTAYCWGPSGSPMLPMWPTCPLFRKAPVYDGLKSLMLLCTLVRFKWKLKQITKPCVLYCIYLFMSGALTFIYYCFKCVFQSGLFPWKFVGHCLWDVVGSSLLVRLWVSSLPCPKCPAVAFFQLLHVGRGPCKFLVTHYFRLKMVQWTLPG